MSGLTEISLPELKELPKIQQELPFAIVEGKPVTEVPHDLYIPPDALSVILDSFEGPLDLLLYLIRRQNMDILDINVSEITLQYVEYINLAKAIKFELAAEYLLMAAMLAEIKSRMLLPKLKQEEEECDDPRAELIRRLQQYERFKKAAEDIDNIPRINRDVFAANADSENASSPMLAPEVSLQDIFSALKSVLDRSDLFEHHHIQKEKLSTRERMAQILSILSYQTSEGHFVSFLSLFTPEEGRAGVVVSFLAIMELVKEQLVDFVQVETFGSIHLKMRQA
ncbi:MAG: segregation and condensation protein A [Oleiphilaceae bacterium]|jgi:segregation and condensation protein A